MTPNDGTLLGWVKTLAAEQVHRLSRLVIETRPGAATVTATFAAGAHQPAVALDERGDAVGPVVRGPVSLADAEGMTRLRPPVAMHRWDRAPDVAAVLAVADLPRATNRGESSFKLCT